MNKIEKIKTEIEFRIAQWSQYTFACASQIASEAIDRIDELKGLLSFIDSLEKNTVDYDKLKTALHDALEKETKESWEAFLEDEPDCAWYNNGECTKGLPGTKCEVVGCVAKTPSALKSRREKDAIDEGFTKFMEKGLKGKDSKISEEIYQNFTKSSNRDLRSEVVKFCTEHFDELHSDMETIDIVHIIATHFADWQIKQMMKDAINGIVKPITDTFNTIVIGKGQDVINSYNEGDKVKLIIIKDNE